MKSYNIVKVVIGVIVALFVAGIIFTCVQVGSVGYNKQLGDWTFNYSNAQILLPDGSVVSGKVESWLDFEDGDQLQVKINGHTYLTDTTRCVMWTE